MTTDPATYLRNLVEANYDAARVNQRIRPTVEVVYNVRRKQVRQTTTSPAAVLIYSGDMKEEYIGFRRDHSYRYFSVTVDVRYGPLAEGMDMQQAHVNSISIADEVRRVIQTARKAPNIARNIPAAQVGSGAEFTHIYWKGWNDLSNKAIRLFRFVSDVDIRTIVESVPEP